ncbi:hypothetical protein HZ326_27198 [Fusarium oxysporum f. sp. albedinis]|nr:hypothetical protein HZ326_27198 [Fusarium oxysporum f. sp. albedinis]
MLSITFYGGIEQFLSGVHLQISSLMPHVGSHTISMLALSARYRNILAQQGTMTQSAPTSLFYLLTVA